MADFQLVDPRGWEYDLQSVRNSIPTLLQYSEADDTYRVGRFIRLT